MPAAPRPPNEASRLAALDALGILDTPPDGEFDALVRAASLVCNVPFSVLGLIDEHRQWIKAQVGLADITEAPREVSFCAHTILGEGLLEVADAVRDARFSDNPAVLGPPGVAFYAGVPLRLSDGHNVGTLCVFDTQPRELDDAQREVLRCLAQTASIALESWRARRGERRASEALRVAADRLRTLYEATPAMLHSTDPQGRLVAVSDAWLAKLGYARDEILGRFTSDFMTPASRRLAAAVSADFRRTGEAASLEFQMVSKAGEIIDVLMSAALERDAGGAPPNTVTVIEDVTQRRRTERALADERQRLDNVIAATGAGTWEWNVQTGAMRVNQRWLEIFGHGQDDPASLSIESWLDRVDAEDAARLLRHARTGEYFSDETQVRRGDGALGWVLSHGNVISRTADGRPEWMVGTAIDVTERRRRDEALRKSEEFLERTGRIAGVGGWELDLTTNALHWSPETYRIHGLDPSHAPPDLATAIGFYPPEARPLVVGVVERSTKTGEPWDLELPFLRADGTRLWVRAAGTAEFRNGKPVRLSGAFQDVTERVAARVALQTANERAALATASGRIGIWDWDIAGGALEWDVQMYALYDIDPGDEAPLLAAWRSRLHPDDVAHLDEQEREALAGRKPMDFEFGVIWRDRSVRHLRATGRVTRDAEGQPVRIVGATWDVTESRQLAADLTRQMELQSEAAERQNALFRNSPDVLYIISVQQDDGEAGFVFESVSPALAQVTGWKVDDLLGQRPEHCLPAEVARTKLAKFRECMAQDTTVSHAGPYTTPLGERDFEGTITPIRHPTSGRITRLAGAFRDVTARNRLQAQSLHDDKMKSIGRLSAGVAHDFNNILQSIYGCLELVIDEMPEGSRARDLAALGLRAATRGSYLTHHLLSYARKQMMLPKAISLPDFMADVRTLLERTLGPRIVIVLHCDETVPAVSADPGQLQTALLNLAINASHAMPQGGTLIIGARSAAIGVEQRVAISVTDSGIGMDAETLAQATEPFFSTKGLNGSGLGLSMVQGFAEQSGGTMSIVSAPGKGTTVELCLPADLSGETDLADALGDAPVEAVSILVVDDDSDVLETMCAVLETAGFRITEASSGAEALVLLRDGTPFHAMVSDYAMPGMHGLDLIDTAQRLRPGMPCVLISGAVDVIDASKLGAGTAAVPKPFLGHELISALTQLLRLEAGMTAQ